VKPQQYHGFHYMTVAELIAYLPRSSKGVKTAQPFMSPYHAVHVLICVVHAKIEQPTIFALTFALRNHTRYHTPGGEGDGNSLKQYLLWEHLILSWQRAKSALPRWMNNGV